ncbi:YrhA family protein [Glacieibacterium frigidum]|uniref:SMI1/KNR4 family protein n=1 Tax=Glacieibacterium frigidum TaxID=2593303 RepID=A0A552UJ43_9SPHN|nr:YrhA family protein [Glacieibacterium frigidum]TRW18247.1 SMI1/KNR4 family protein [Glacieibacterium frigidum]
MMEAVLDAVSADQRKAGEIVRPPASDAAVATVAARVRDELHATLPDDYAAFLRRHDGVDYNGIVFYGATASPETPEDGFWQGIVAANQAWRADGGNKGLLVLGDSDIDMFAVPATGGAPGRYDRVSGDGIETYADVPTMIETVLRERL